MAEVIEVRKEIKVKKDVIPDDALRNIVINGEVVGFEVDFVPNAYRGFPVSCIEKLNLAIDGKKIDLTGQAFCVNGKRLDIRHLPDLYQEHWGVHEIGTLSILDWKGLEPGEHKIDLELVIKACYIIHCLPGATREEMMSQPYTLEDFTFSKVVTLQE